MISREPSSIDSSIQQLLRTWERQLDPRHPERGYPSARVLGYGEISTVLALEHPLLEEYAIKRMPMFRNMDEVRQYLALHESYLHHLRDRGVRIPDTFPVVAERPNREFSIYILQKRLPSHTIGHKLLHTLPLVEATRLIERVLESTARVLAANATDEHVALGFDAQMSNWSVANLTDTSRLPPDIELLYFDTSTPLMQVDGIERLNPDLFLRSAPSFLVPIIRLFFLKDVMTRYYDLRQVILDILANFYKEKREDWIPDMIRVVNKWLDTHPELGVPPYTEQEVRSYYREDAFIWRFYLAARKLDRRLHQVLGKDYPYILPDKIER